MNLLEHLEKEELKCRLGLPTTPQSRRVADRYDVTSFIGAGGMAVIAHAIDSHTNRRVAIKIPRKPELYWCQANERLSEEAEALAKFSDKRIVKVYDFGNDRGTPFMVMEYIDGMSLRDWNSTLRPSRGQKTAVFGQISGALKRIHQQGLVHGDLKPENIIISTQGDDTRAVIIDFGVRGHSSHVGTTAYFSSARVRSRLPSTWDDKFALILCARDCGYPSITLRQSPLPLETGSGLVESLLKIMITGLIVTLATVVLLHNIGGIR